MRNKDNNDHSPSAAYRYTIEIHGPRELEEFGDFVTLASLNSAVFQRIDECFDEESGMLVDIWGDDLAFIVRSLDTAAVRFLELADDCDDDSPEEKEALETAGVLQNLYTNIVIQVMDVFKSSWRADADIEQKRRSLAALKLILG